MLPWEPDHQDALYYWSKEYDSGEKTLDWLGSERADKSAKCMKDQSRILRRLMSGTVEMPPKLLAIASDIVG
ncbi:hypothetical protein [Micromonospora zamorensis]|uniref:Uncharacterized protein n=1 Tax=Micromonospora zamorensis TaxID=709883 RepID=A0ABZ1PA52_9ACTN